MPIRHLTLAAVLAVAPLALFAGDSAIQIEDAYARSGAKSGAAFFIITNNGTEDDRLVAARSDLAPRVELHTHIEDENGVMRMREVEAGFAIPAGGSHALARGGDHVMFMGLSEAFEQGATVPVTLTFEKAGDMTVEITVDNERRDKHGHAHGDHDHSGS